MYLSFQEAVNKASQHKLLQKLSCYVTGDPSIN